MDIVNEICFTAIQLYSTKPYNFIKRFKLNRKLKSLSKKLFEEDIFKISDCMISMLSGISSKDLLKKFNICLKQSNLIINNFKNSFIYYNSVLKYLDIYDKNMNMAYSIYKSSRIPSHIIDNWTALEQDIRKFYIEIIVDVAVSISSIV